jgi:hypothetical protein
VAEAGSTAVVVAVGSTAAASVVVVASMVVAVEAASMAVVVAEGDPTAVAVVGTVVVDTANARTIYRERLASLPAVFFWKVVEEVPRTGRPG